MGKFENKVGVISGGNSEEVANTVLFLASDEASYVNGIEIEIEIDGGLSQI